MACGTNRSRRNLPIASNAAAAILSARATYRWWTGFATASPNCAGWQAERIAADKARQRFEAREARLARLKQERRRRMEEKKRALGGTQEKQERIAAAIERARSRRAGQTMSRRFDTGGAPHFPPQTTVRRVMLQVIFALVPGILAHAWFFGPGIVRADPAGLHALRWSSRPPASPSAASLCSHFSATSARR